MGHQHLVCSIHLAGLDQVAFLGDMVVIHATAVVAEVANTFRISALPRPFRSRYRRHLSLCRHHRDRGEDHGAWLLIGMQGNLTFSTQFGPTAGRKGSWGGAAAGPARSSRRKSTLLAVPSLLDEKEFLQQMRAGTELMRDFTSAYFVALMLLTPQKMLTI